MRHLEDHLHKLINGFIQQAIFYKRTKLLTWTYNASGEKRDLRTGALLKAKGLLKGLPDFECRYLEDDVVHHIYFEVKVGKNKQSLEQITFANTCKDSKNNHYYLVYSLEEVIEALEKKKVLNL